MRYKILLGILSLCAIISSASAEVAVIPYKVKNPSKYFPEDTGSQYSRLLSLAALAGKKGLVITSPRDIDSDLKRLKLSPQGVITADDLVLLGGSMRIDYFLLGSLFRSDGKYVSESILFSVRDKRVLIKIKNSADNLFRLAENDVKEALVQYRDNNRSADATGGGTLDLLFLLDLSYSVNSDWESVKESIIGACRDIIDASAINTRVYLVPFSDRVEFSRAAVSENSISSLRKELDAMRPAGGTSPENFLKSIQYSIDDVRWRPGSRRLALIISNSNINGAKMAEKYALLARKKGIAIHSLSLGNIPGDSSELLERLATISGGTSHNVAYHQKIFNADARPIELYMENGRLFRSDFFDSRWKEGLYLSSRGGRSGKPRPFADEVYIDDRGVAVTPYTMGDKYSRIAVENIISQKALENNITSLLSKITAQYLGKGGTEGSPLGKALITDGKISFWIYLSDNASLDFFERKERSKVYFPLGVVVKKDKRQTYGITVIPRLMDISSDYVPEMARAELDDIVRRSDYFMSQGLSYPPLWIINVKVDNVTRFGEGRDVREQ